MHWTAGLMDYSGLLMDTISLHMAIGHSLMQAWLPGTLFEWRSAWTVANCWQFQTVTWNSFVCRVL